jgi:hypothetical protein
MTPDHSRVTLIIGCEPARAERLKEIIEALDESTVLIAEASEWKKLIQGRRCAAIFVGDNVDESEKESLLASLREYEPDIPVRILKNQPLE